MLECYGAFREILHRCVFSSLVVFLGGFDLLFLSCISRWSLEECSEYGQSTRDEGEFGTCICGYFAWDVAGRFTLPLSLHIQSMCNLRLGLYLTYTHPSQRSLTQHASQFGGSDQHDSQEFLSFLLDGLHEDLNRILHKPTWEPTPEQEAELERLPQQIASDQQWKIYRMRNDSLIVDFFQGQFRNRLECLTCHKVRCLSSTFTDIDSDNSLDIHNVQQFYVFDAARPYRP